MILQCDQCNTRFRLDESKLKPGGVKVRCSKCRHIFLVEAEPKLEESEFDSILSGLGAPAAAKPGESPAAERAAASTASPESSAAEKGAPAAPDDFADFASFDPAAKAQPTEQKPASLEEPFSFGDLDFGAAADSGPAAPAPSAPDAAYGEFSFSDEPPSAREPAAAAEGFEFGEFTFSSEPAGQPEEPAAAGPAGLDFGEFDFAEQPATPADEPAPPAAAEFGEFTFDEEPPLPSERPAPSDGFEPDFGEFTFDGLSAAKEEPAPAGGKAGFEFGEFSFAEEPVTGIEQPLPADKGTLEFGDLSFGELPAATAGQTSAAGGASDFGDFSFGEEPAVKGEPAPAAGKDAFDFSEFSFGEEPAGTLEEPLASGKDAFDFGNFSFGEEPAGKVEPPPLPAAEDDFGGFSFAGEPPSAKPAPAAKEPDFGDFAFPDDLQQKHPDGVAPVSDDIFSLGEFSFSGDFQEPEAVDPSKLARKPEPMVKPAAAASAETAPAAPAAPAAKPAYYQQAAPPVPPAAENKKPSPPESSLEFNFGEAAAPGLPDEYAEEELPPLSITSRRKGKSLLTVSIVTVCVLVIISLSGAGLYLLQSGPEALQQFDKLGIGFVAKWFGMESPEEGRITVRNPLAAFHQNKEAGEIFVVKGQVVNSYRKARASIHVRVSLFDKKGAVLLQKTAYCGNRLSDEQLATLPIAKIESIMNNTFGDSLANLGVQPGNSIGFVVVVANVPKEAVDFGVEVLGSTVAGQ